MIGSLRIFTLLIGGDFDLLSDRRVALVQEGLVGNETVFEPGDAANGVRLSSQLLLRPSESTRAGSFCFTIILSFLVAVPESRLSGAGLIDGTLFSLSVLVVFVFVLLVSDGKSCSSVMDSNLIVI